MIKMWNKNMLFLLLYIFYFSCQEKKNTPNTPNTLSSQNDRYRDSSFNFITKKFGLSYQNSRMDKNSLIFYGARTFDTSFLIELKQTVNEISGVYYEVLPYYHNNVNDFSIEKNQLLFFEGYSFILDSIQWKTIKTMAEKMLASDTSFKNNDGCRDCPEYVLSYDLKSSKSNIKSQIKYETFYKFLKDFFLENFIQRRKPIKSKIK